MMLRTKHAVVGVVLILVALLVTLIGVLLSKWNMESQPASVASVGVAIFSTPRDSYEVRVVTPSNVQPDARESLVEKLEALPRSEPVLEEQTILEPAVEESFTTPASTEMEDVATTTETSSEGLE